MARSRTCLTLCLPADVLGKSLNGHVSLVPLEHLKHLHSALIEHLLKRVQLRYQFDFLVFGHLLELVRRYLQVVGLLESLRVCHHRLMDHLAPLHLLLYRAVIILQTVLTQLFLHLDLSAGRPQEGQLSAVEVTLHLVTDTGSLLREESCKLVCFLFGLVVVLLEGRFKGRDLFPDSE